ncbi:isoprenoid synthase domain-containing protein [Aspergillus varians]
MSGLQTLHLMPLPLAFTAGIFPVVLYMLLDRLPPIWPSSRKAMMIGPKQPQNITSFECPYNYLRQIYGKYHWAPFIHKLSPDLKDTNPKKYKWILEVMDTIHLCLMMVDDISDNSDFRKGKPAAHRLYGPSETANRAYYQVTQILNETVKQWPKLAPFLMQNLEEILHGQDLSLVWRRDGLNSLPTEAKERMAAYREMASLKTGALFRLMGQLVLEDKSADKTLTTLAWCSQLQNDFKNVYSSEYAKAKGSLAEDLRNHEMSFPIIVALEAPGGEWVARALESGSRRNIRKALEMIQSESVRNACFTELKLSSASVHDWLAVWGRDEKMNLKSQKK